MSLKGAAQEGKNKVEKFVMKELSGEMKDK